MKIGVLSDSHDNLINLKKAVKLFNKKKIDYVLHLGDFVAPFSVRILNELNCPWQGIFGNNDGEKEGLLKVSEGKISDPPLRIELNNRKIILVHDIKILDLTKEKEKVDIILFGHTHKVQVEKHNSSLLLNPGECGGWLTGISTVAIVDLKDLTYRIFKL